MKNKTSARSQVPGFLTIHQYQKVRKLVDLFERTLKVTRHAAVDRNAKPNPARRDRLNCASNMCRIVGPVELVVDWGA